MSGAVMRAAADQADPPSSGSMPEDFVSRCVAGLAGGPAKKQTFFNYLTKLAPQVPEAGELIQAVQQAILGAESGRGV